MRVPDIETPRLRLRPMTMADAPAVQRHFANRKVIEQIGASVPWPYPADGAETYLRGVLEGIDESDACLWGLHLKDGPVGVIGVIEYRLAPEAEDNRGFWLGEPFWGRGLMTEAVVATQDVVFLEFGADRLVVANAVSNAASRAIKERCGARRIGRVPSEYLSGDRWQEVWEITREAWLARREDPSFDRYRSSVPRRP